MHPRDLIIVGAGGLGREVLQTVHAVNSVAPRWNPVGFVDDDLSLEGQIISGLPVLGPTEVAVEMGDAAISVCVGAVRSLSSKHDVVRRLALPEERYCTVVHPSVSLPRDATLGPGCCVLQNAVLTADVRLGAYVTLMPSVVLTHDDHLHDYVSVAAGACLGGRVHVGKGTYIGSGALLREDLQVGKWSIVGMGSVVTRDIPDHELWVGVPARCVRRLDA